MIEIQGITKSYKTGDFVQRALDGVSITFRESEFVAVLGPSGSGKTTFLNILGGFDHADSGDIIVNGVSTKDYSDADWDTYRNHRIGFVFQSYNLIPHQTILQNVELALTLAGVGAQERRERARAALERVGLGPHVNKRPAQLSGGQMQRVAIARALVNDPEIVLADEPTGALDTETGIQVMNILAEVAKDRLVIMVTHNPQLAEDYATRIVRIKDGQIVDDSRPIGEAELAEQKAAEVGSEQPKKRSSMNFLTALSLSANNLLTKKGRTFMTAFAGSIGIIGIAAILALSNGVNNYIAKVEEDTLSSYPLSITQQSYDLSSMMGGSKTADDSGSSSSDGSIPVITAVSDMFASVESNDLSSFKKYLDAGWDGMADDVNAVQYSYDVTPIIYGSSANAAAASADDASSDSSSDSTADSSDSPDTDDLVKLVPNSMTEALNTGMASATTSTMSGSSVFNEMLDDEELVQSQYDVVAGRWATAADEAVLVLTQSGGVSDYTLYSMGVLNIDEMNDLVSKALSSSETAETEVDNTGTTFTYDDALSLTFKVVSPSACYRKNTETGGWTDMSSDASYMADAAANGLNLKIVGVVRPNSDSSSSLTQGVAYTHALTEELMSEAASSEVVQQQISNPDIDVFTGKTFEELKDENSSGVDLSSMFSVDEAALQRAFSFDSSSLTLQGFDLSGIDMGSMSIDLSGVTDGMDMSSVMGDAPQIDFSGIFDGDDTTTPEQAQQVATLTSQLVSGFITSDEFKALGTDVSDPEKVSAAFSSYLTNNDSAKLIMAQIQAASSASVLAKVQQVLASYMQNEFATYLQGAMQEMMSQVTEKIAAAVSTQMQSALTSALGSAMEGMSSQLTSSLQNAFTIDASAFANAIQFNMTAEDLTSLMTSYANSSSLTYDNNLSTLGYASEDNPSSISIYPKDFAAKERVLDQIDAYNQQVTDAGEEDKAISYTDYVGLIMTSVTDIVNMISLVLIAFVSISLVVSSIMIGIITYISVLERKKEIGILRAMGASKGNVANVFIAETFIEGLLAGVLAIAVVVAVSFPVNAAVLSGYNVENIMSLPAAAAVVLICISVALTVIGGLIPSFSASRRDPVEALRSE